MVKYEPEEEKELNRQLNKWKNRGKRLIRSLYYDSIANELSDTDITVMTKLMNAEEHRDINIYMWNSGVIEMVLDKIALKIRKAARDAGK